MVNELRVGLVGGVRLPPWSQPTDGQQQFLRRRRDLRAPDEESSSTRRQRLQSASAVPPTSRPTRVGTDHGAGTRPAVLVAVRKDLQHRARAGRGRRQDRALQGLEPHRGVAQRLLLQDDHLPQGPAAQTLRTTVPTRADPRQ